MTHVAIVKFLNQARWDEIRGYNDLNIQHNCFIFQWFETNKSLVFPMHCIESISTSTEEEYDEKTDKQSSN